MLPQPPATGMTKFSRCKECGGIIGYIDAPTGGWWAHDVHPADNHDAVPN